MSRQGWVESLWWATASGTAVNSANVETILFPNVTIPANYMSDGRWLRIRASGSWTTTGSTPTLIFGLKWGGVGGTHICKTAAITTVASTTAAMWDLDIILQTITNGATGGLRAIGTCRCFAGVAGTIASATGAACVTPFGSAGILAPATVTPLDLTADTALSLTVQPSTTAATITGMLYTGETMN
jgi:hypothetical protein